MANEDVVHRLFEIVDSRQWHRLGEVFDPDAVYERPGYEAFSGLERIDRFYQHERIIASGRHHLEAVVGSGTHAACWGRFVGEARDGRALDERFADVYVLSPEGRIRQRRSYFFRPAV